MNNQKSFSFTPNSIHSLSFTDGKQETYFDTNPRSLIPSCKLGIVVGSKSKTYYLVFRSNVNAKQVKKMVKLGQHPVMTVSLARDKFTEEAIKIVTDQDKFLIAKKNVAITVNDLIDFYELEKGIKQSESFLFGEVKKGLGNMQVKDLDRYAVQDFYKPQLQEK